MVNRESSRKLIAQYYSSHIDELKAFIIKRIDNSTVADAEDIVQNVFLRLLTSEKMITEVTLPCLVYTVARNLITDRMRHFNIVSRYERDVKGMISVETNETEALESAQEVMELMECGATHILSEDCRKIYFMNVCDGLKTAEISQQLALNYKAVEYQLSIARKEMRSYIKLKMAR